jgi:hypothetical protein
VEGQIWSVDYTSTYTLDSCPASEYEDLPTELTLEDVVPDQADKDLGDVDAQSSAESILNKSMFLFSLLLPAAVLAGL